MELQPVKDVGITPACAGTTYLLLYAFFYPGDHPRMCGDHHQERVLNIWEMGSPPHVRGPLVYFSCYIHIFGITPACAGTTPYLHFYYFIEGDHPRMCGDHMGLISWP